MIVHQIPVGPMQNFSYIVVDEDSSESIIIDPSWNLMELELIIKENNLKIKEKSVSLDFGSYTNPQIFYINNKIYVATTDKQAQQVYLYDSQSEAIPNFPVFGQSLIDMDNIDGDKALEIIVKGANNELILYEKY